MANPNAFRFGEAINPHKLGDKNCKGCRWDLPRVCPKCEEGLVHIELTNKTKGQIFLYHCDLCAGKGKAWKELPQH